MNKPGRPRNASNPEIARADRRISFAVHKLIFWGIPQDAVYEAVGRAALQILSRSDHCGRALGAAGIEEIYLASLKGKSPQRWRYTKRSLESRRPLALFMAVNPRRRKASGADAVVGQLLRTGRWSDAQRVKICGMFGTRRYTISEAEYWTDAPPLELSPKALRLQEALCGDFQLPTIRPQRKTGGKNSQS